MKIAKKWLAVLTVFSLLCSMLSFGLALAVTLPSEDMLPIHYELYDYFADVNTAFSENRPVTSDSPWSVGLYADGEWIAPDTYSKSLRRNYISAYNSGKNVGNFPGYSFYYPNNYTSGPLYNAILSPSNIEGDTSGAYNINAAYIFTAPLNGTYTLGKAEQSMIYSEDSNYFAQNKENSSLPDLDFGVRITLNNDTIWPTADQSFYQDGWAVFGGKDAQDQRIEIPTLSDLELSRGDILRVETTSFTPVAQTGVKAQRVTGTVRVSLTALGDNGDIGEEPDVDLKTRYELYDYFEYVVQAKQNGTEIASRSPWSVQSYFDGKWNVPDVISTDGDYYYVACADRPDWGVAYPGYGFYYNKNAVRNQLALISPANSVSDENYVCNSAYVFTAPERGTYTMHYSDADAAVSFADTQYFSPRELTRTGITFGVRITLNDEVVWPNASYKGPVEDTFAEFGCEIAGLPGLIAIPRLEELGMEKDDVLRVEFTSFTPIDGNPWYQFIKGCLSMTKTSSEVIVDNEPPVFNSGAIALKESGSSYVDLVWPSATDNRTPESDLTYELYLSETPFDPGVIPTGKDAHAVSATGGMVLNLKPDTDYYAAVVVTDIRYNSAVLTGGPFRTKEGADSNNDIYEVYDYLDEITELIDYDQQTVQVEQTASPWKAQVYDNGWIDISRATRLGDLIYCNVTAPEWGGYYSGMSFFAPQRAQLNRYLARLNPAKAAESVSTTFDYNAAYTFTAPYAGTYTFEKGNSEFNYMFDGYFAVADSGSRNLSLGVRITLNDEVIWPLENTDCVLRDGWAELRGYDSDQSRVEIPTIGNISMIAGDQLRVEAKAFDGTADSPWCQQVAACVRMVLNEKTVDSEPPVFRSGAIEMAGRTTTSLTLTWPLADDALSNADSISYVLYYDENPITEESITSLEPIGVKGTTQRITLLLSDTDYYAAIVATDISGNSAMLTGGPFRTESKTGTSSGDTSQGGDSELPSAPLSANQPSANCGIIASGGGSVTVGWTDSGGISYYVVYLFTDNGSTYTLAQHSDTLGSSTAQYRFSGLSDRRYTVQVIGYNNRGEAFAIFEPIVFENATGDTVVGNNNPASPDGLNGVGATTTAGGKDITTYITEEGVTQVQDVYETVNNTRTTTTGPSVAEQILWVVLLVLGGVMLLVSGFLVFLLLKKPKQAAIPQV